MFIEQILASWFMTLKWLAGFAVAFGVLSLLMPCNPGMRWWKDRRAVLTDLMYWFLVPLFVRLVRVAFLTIGTAFVLGIRDPAEVDAFARYGYGPLAAMPLWLQIILILLFQDVMMYWIHRGFHGNRMWKFHAIHHSPTTMDWMSSARFHPINIILYTTLADTVVLLMGFSPMALLWLVPFNAVYSCMVHANLNWTFGPLRYVFASPVFHRWHHTSIKQGGMKNFAPTFPFLDLMFGTFYMPKGLRPEKYGVFDPQFPQGFWGQIVYPFRKMKG